MLHVIYNNLDHVLAFCSADRIELVRSDTGELVKLSPTAELAKNLLDQAVLKEERLDPRFPPFPERGRGFIKELQLRRLKLLEENVKSRRKLHKGPAEKKRRSGGKRKQSLEDQMAKLIAISLGKAV